MAEQLLIRLLSSEQPLAQWAVLNAEGQIAGRIDQGNLGAAVSSAAGRSISVILSGFDVLLVPAQIPGRNRARVLAAVPYALEEGLVDDVSAYHFVVGQNQGDDRYPVLSIAHTDMQRVLAMFDEYQLQPQRLYAEAELLPIESDAWVLAFDKDQAVVRQDACQGYRIETSALHMLLHAQPDDEHKLERAVVYGALPDEHFFPEAVAVEQRSASTLLELLARGLAQSPTNLLQGQYSRSQQYSKHLLPWRLSAGLAAAVLVLLFAGVISEYYSLGQQTTAMQQQVEQVLRQTFPDIKKVVNPRAQMQQRLKGLQGQSHGGDVFELLAAGADAVSKASGTQISSLSFRKGRLELELEARDLVTLDQIQTRVSSISTVKASVQSAKAENDRVRGRLRIEPNS